VSFRRLFLCADRLAFCLRSVDGCKDVIHTCPNCQQQVGILRRM
jgi:hypothetical protein